MKRLDKRTERRLYWLFLPCGVLMVLFVVCLLMHVDIGYSTWGKPALIGSLTLVFAGYGIAAVRQRCWGFLGLLLFVYATTILNMTNVFVNVIAD